MKEITIKESQLSALEAAYLDIPSRLISHAISRRDRFASGNYFSFLISALRDSHFYGIWEHALKYFRRFRLLTTLIQIFITIINVISTSAFYIVFISLAIISLPFIIVGFLFAYFISLFSRKRTIRRVTPVLNSKQIVIVFMPVSYSENSNGDYSYSFAQDLARYGSEVFLVAPLNTKLNIRRKTDSVYLITQNDFFYFDKKLFNKTDNIVKINL